MPAPDALTQSGQPSRSATVPLVILATLFVVVPILSWYGTWFGRTLSDEKIIEYLADDSKPRNIQHALSQIADRFNRGGIPSNQFNTQILRVAWHRLPDVRSQAAWVMGIEHRSPEFHGALLRLMADSEPNVRRNAALALVRFDDLKGREEIRSMLKPFVVRSGIEGRVEGAMRAGASIRLGALLAEVVTADGTVTEIRSPLSGELRSVSVGVASNLKPGDEVATLDPDSDSVWEALRALALIGDSTDIELIRRYEAGVEGMRVEIRQQAAEAIKAIERRRDFVRQ